MRRARSTGIMLADTSGETSMGGTLERKNSALKSRMQTALAALVAGALAACTPTITTPAVTTHVTQTTEAFYQQAAARGETVLKIDAQHSLVRVIVHRGGVLARLGHDHVVASRMVEGSVAPGLGRADLQFRFDQMSVDETVLRADAGFTTQPSADAIAGTRHNMLSKVLDADQYPVVAIAVRGEAGDGDQTLQVTITLHGVSRIQAVPVHIAHAGKTLTASGVTTIKQTDFGLVPFSVMGGAMAVEDQLDLQFSVVASAP